ncbi:hypothetical protein MAP00_009271 [Monascus purpureus]|nr:hypothetical protein MAP00_009271 [Monascus purpureus]
MADSTDDDSGGVILDGPFDPDAQATVTDYIDYTEYLPADIVRSLSLIRGLDERYIKASQAVHELTKTYGRLPDIPPYERPDAQALRKEISIQLDRAINARESAYGEACRIYDVVDRHFDRLDCIKQKLRALPQPASREPTPAHDQGPPDNKRIRIGRKGEAAPTTRITLRLDNRDPSASTTQKSRSRRSAIAAEHLAGLHPDSPIASTEQSDVEAESKPVRESRAVARPQKPKVEKEAGRSRPGARHRPVAGISTSSALALLKPPPEDAKPGSEDLPWLRLTEWEMTKLRKKMKKNAIWQPSEVMIHRELALRGRGWDAYRAAKAEAEATGAEFIDCDDVMNTYVLGKLTRKSDVAKDATATMTETKLSNRGMKLNEAKRLKREHQAREQAAAAAAESELAAKRLGDPGSTLKISLRGSADQRQGISPETNPSNDKGRPSRKRKLEETAPEVSQPDAQTAASSLRSTARKRRASKERNGIAGEARTSISTTTSSDTRQPVRPPSPVESKRPIAIPGAPARNTPTPSDTHPSSRLRSAAASAEPASTVAGGRALRRKSATPAGRAAAHEPYHAPGISAPGGAANRRRKRPAPGPVSSGQDGGAAVSYGRRKAKPTKKHIGVEAREEGSGSIAQNQDIRVDEDGILEEIDPNEPRYCICGDVSFGTMICCENPDCDREWFHLDCVGLSEVPSRTAKWYCPECRVKFGKGYDGIVRAGARK